MLDRIHENSSLESKLFSKAFSENCKQHATALGKADDAPASVPKRPPLRRQGTSVMLIQSKLWTFIYCIYGYNGFSLNKSPIGLIWCCTVRINLDIERKWKEKRFYSWAGLFVGVYCMLSSVPITICTMLCDVMNKYDRNLYIEIV